jgi:hypothetical protein
MKKISPLILMLLTVVSFSSMAQGNKPLSPKATVTGTIDDVDIEIVYSRPSARGRKMLGDHEKYGEVWRTGANEATTISFSKDVVIEGKALPAGKYSLWTIPNEDEWTIIFNKKVPNWGTEYDKISDGDVLKVNVKARKNQAFVETFTINLDKENVNLKWEDTAVSFHVKR